MTGRTRRGLALLGLWVTALPASAHEVRPAFLQMRQTSADTFDVQWNVPARGDDLRLSLYVQFPESCESVGDRESSIVGGTYIERWRIRHAGALAGETVRIEGLDATLTDALVRIERLDGSMQVARLLPTRPELVVKGSPGGLAALTTYVAVGTEHILGGVDHLLFVMGLLFLVASRAMLAKTITSFTVAHSITLALATFGWATAPVLALNVLIALSILFLGPEIIRRQRGRTSLTIARPWIVAFAFGLLHGFGFASGLSELGLPRGEIPLALLGFNVGVEVGQLGFVAILVGVHASLRSLEFRALPFARAIPGYAIGILGAFWTIDRFAAAVLA